MRIARKRYEWDKLEWTKGHTGIITCEIKLHADEFLEVDEGFSFIGPSRVIISYREGDTHSNYECLPLDKSDFDYDNPYEYPCESCGATRGNRCVGDNPNCTWRVFTRGGVL